jgi:hypothetical protein
MTKSQLERLIPRGKVSRKFKNARAALKQRKAEEAAKEETMMPEAETMIPKEETMVAFIHEAETMTEQPVIFDGSLFVSPCGL